MIITSNTEGVAGRLPPPLRLPLHRLPRPAGHQGAHAADRVHLRASGAQSPCRDAGGGARRLAKALSTRPPRQLLPRRFPTTSRGRLLVHHEKHLDDSRRRLRRPLSCGAAIEAKAITEELLEWLRDPVKMRELSDKDRAALQELDLDEVLKMLEERLREQKERPRRRQPMDRHGRHLAIRSRRREPERPLIRRNRRRRWSQRDRLRRRPQQQQTLPNRCRPRHPPVIDVIALRRPARHFTEGQAEELDVEGTIDATAKNGGELEVKTRPPRRPATRVILMMDVGDRWIPCHHDEPALQRGEARDPLP